MLGGYLLLGKHEFYARLSPTYFSASYAIGSNKHFALRISLSSQVFIQIFYRNPATSSSYSSLDDILFLSPFVSPLDDDQLVRILKKSRAKICFHHANVNVDAKSAYFRPKDSSGPPQPPAGRPRLVFGPSLRRVPSQSRMSPTSDQQPSSTLFSAPTTSLQSVPPTLQQQQQQQSLLPPMPQPPPFTAPWLPDLTVPPPLILGEPQQLQQQQQQQQQQQPTFNGFPSTSSTAPGATLDRAAVAAAPAAFGGGFRGRTLEASSSSSITSFVRASTSATSFASMNGRCLIVDGVGSFVTIVHSQNQSV